MQLRVGVDPRQLVIGEETFEDGKKINSCLYGDNHDYRCSFLQPSRHDET